MLMTAGEEAFQKESLRKMLDAVLKRSGQAPDLERIEQISVLLQAVQFNRLKTIGAKIFPDGELNRLDLIAAQNRAAVAEFERLFAEDLLFYLTVIGNWKLFQRYWLYAGFSDKEFEAACALLQEGYQALVPAMTIHPELEKNNSIRVLSTLLLDPVTHQEQLNRIEQYYQLQEEYQKLSENYLSAHQQALDKHILTSSNFAEAVGIIEIEEILLNGIEQIEATLGAEIRQAQEALLTDFHAIKSRMDGIEQDLASLKSRSFVKADGSDDFKEKIQAYETLQTRAHQTNEEKRHFNGRIEEFKNLLANPKISNQLPNVIDRINAFVARNTEDIARYEADTTAITDIKSSMETLKTQISELAKEIHDDNRAYLANVLKLLDQIHHASSSDDRLALDHCITTLKIHQTELFRTTDVPVKWSNIPGHFYRLKYELIGVNKNEPIKEAIL